MMDVMQSVVLNLLKNPRNKIFKNLEINIGKSRNKYLQTNQIKIKGVEVMRMESIKKYQKSFRSSFQDVSIEVTQAPPRDLQSHEKRTAVSFFRLPLNLVFGPAFDLS